MNMRVKGSREYTPVEQEMRERIGRLLWEQKRYRDPGYSQRQLAADLEMSVFLLSRTLRQVFGLRYVELVHKLRIQDAAKYLRSPQKRRYTVDDIGVLVGFRNRQSFFSAFRKEMGTTPERWRLDRSNS